MITESIRTNFGNPCNWNLKLNSLLDFSPLTITTEKLSGLAFSVYDGRKKQENNRPLTDKAVRYVVQFGKNPGNKFFYFQKLMRFTNML